MACWQSLTDFRFTIYPCNQRSMASLPLAEVGPELKGYNALCCFIDTARSLQLYQTRQEFISSFKDQASISITAWRKVIEYAYQRFIDVNDEANVSFVHLTHLVGEQPPLDVLLPKNGEVTIKLPVVPVEDKIWVGSALSSELRERLILLISTKTVKVAIAQNIYATIVTSLHEDWAKRLETQHGRNLGTESSLEIFILQHRSAMRRSWMGMASGETYHLHDC